MCSLPWIYLLISEPQWYLLTLCSLCSQERERNLHICVVTACNPLSPECKGTRQRDEGLFSSSYVWVLTHTGTLDAGGGISKSGGEPEPESCQQTSPAGLRRLSDGICYSEMSLVNSPGNWLLPSACDLALVGNARQDAQSRDCCSGWRHWQAGANVMPAPDWGCALAKVGSWAGAWCHCFGSCRVLRQRCLLILIREEGFKPPHAGPSPDKRFYYSYCFLS